jgi:outer membrane protein assembly factor BamB
VTPRTAAVGGTRLWRARFGKGLGLGSLGSATAVSPDGSTVFVAGDLPKGPGANVGEVVAYKAASGAVIWQRRYNPGPAGSSDFNSIVVSPDGSTVFVAGGTQPRRHGHDSFLTIAYDAATGARLWVNRGQTGGFASAVTVSPDGSAVFVTGIPGTPPWP